MSSCQHALKHNIYMKIGRKEVCVICLTENRTDLLEAWETVERAIICANKSQKYSSKTSHINAALAGLVKLVEFEQDGIFVSETLPSQLTKTLLRIRGDFLTARLGVSCCH